MVFIEAGGVGFRNLLLFNQALLAKSFWRLLKTPSSLAARIFKACYFPDTSILLASESSYASSIWRGLLWGRRVIERGTRWRIGSGVSIEARSGKWIPRPGDFTVRFDNRIPMDVTVADLKLQNGTWNLELLREWCSAEDIMEILKILDGEVHGRHELCWHFTRDGEY